MFTPALDPKKTFFYPYALQPASYPMTTLRSTGIAPGDNKLAPAPFPI